MEWIKAWVKGHGFLPCGDVLYNFHWRGGVRVCGVGGILQGGACRISGLDVEHDPSPCSRIHDLILKYCIVSVYPSNSHRFQCTP